MAPKDRTSEFHSTLSSIKSRSVVPPKTKEESKRLIDGKDKGKSEFGRMAGGIAKDINSTTMKLQKLAQCESSLLTPS